MIDFRPRRSQRRGLKSCHRTEVRAATESEPKDISGGDRLDDEDFPADSVRRAAELIGVT